MRAICWLLLAIFVLTSAHAQSSSSSGSTSSGCPQGTLVADGCPTAPVNATFQQPDFFVQHALQSGQTYATRPSWNVAGVDYAVGIPAAKLKAGLCDPSNGSNASTLACGGGGLPTGCAYNSGTHRVNCQGTSSDITFDGWDFGTGPNGCIALTFQSTATGNNTVKNSNIVWGASAGCTSFYMWTVAGGASLTVTNSYFNGNGLAWLAATTNGTAFINLSNATTPATFQYNVFLQTPGHLLVSNSSGNLIFNYNYVEDFNPAYGQFTASFASGIMTVTSVTMGTIPAGSSLSGAGVAGTTVSAYGTGGTTGTGGVGTYATNGSLTVASGPIASWAGLHGEPLIIEFGAGASPCVTNCTMSLMAHQFNTFLASANDCCNTANMTPSESGVTGTTLTTMNIDHNVSVANKMTGLAGLGAITSQTVGVQTAYVTVTTANINSNYLDPTGSSFCFSTTSGGSYGTLNLSGNVNLRDGSSIPDATQANCHGHQ